MAYLSLEIPPGVVKTGSQVVSNGRWRDANLVRWHGGRMRPVGGWYAETSVLVGAPRSLVTWSTNAGQAQMFIGTNSRVYNWTGGTALNEVSGSFTGGGTLGPATMVTSGSTLTCATGGLDTLLDPDVRFKITGGSNDGNVYTVAAVASENSITIDETFATDETETITLTYLWKTGIVQGRANTGWGAGVWNPTATVVTTVTSTTNFTPGITSPLTGNTTTSGEYTTSEATLELQADLTLGGANFITGPVQINIPAGGFYSLFNVSAASGSLTHKGFRIADSTYNDGDYNALYVLSDTALIADGKIDDNSWSSFTAESASISTSSLSNGWGRDQTGASILHSCGRWHFDTYGEDLLGVFEQDGRLIYWDASGGTYPLNGTLVSNAPTGNKGVLSTQERMVMLYGAGGNTRKIQWSDQEDYSTWAVSATGEAGSFELQTTGDLQVALKVRDSIIAITDEDAHEITYVGQPFIYGRRRLSDTAGIVGPNAVAVIEFAAYWMGPGGFFRYDGGYVDPIPCDVLDFVFTDINTRIDRTKFSQVASGENRKYGEVWWFYATEAGSGENDRYCCYNYSQKWWTVGTLSRLSWDENNPWGSPFATGSDYKLYRMEQQRSSDADRVSGVTDPGSDYGTNTRTMSYGGANTTDTMTVYAETGDIRVADGSKRIHAQQVITDTETGDTNALQLRFYSSETPDSSETDQGSVALTSTGYSDVRFSGRYMRYRVEAPFDQDFRVGEMMLKAKTGGDR